MVNSKEEQFIEIREALKDNISLTEPISGADYVLDIENYPGYHLVLAAEGFGFYGNDDEDILAVDLNTKEILSDKESLALYKKTMSGIVNDAVPYQFGDFHIMIHGKQFDTVSKSDLDKSIHLVSTVKHNQERLAKETAPKKTMDRETILTGSMER